MTECPICRCSIERNAEPPPPPHRGNPGQAQYNFDALEVGDRLTIPLAQNATTARLASYKSVKSRPDRRQRLFRTRRLDATTTLVWRIL